MADVETTPTAAATPHRPHDTRRKSLPTTPKKRVNRSAKGAAIELRAIKILEAEGYKVHRCVRTGAKRGNLWISQNNDVFGCIDLVCKKMGQRTRWIQVTADGGIGRKKEDLAEVPWDPLFDSVEIWRWVPAKRSKQARDGGMYFQVYHLDEDYELRPENKVFEATPDTMARPTQSERTKTREET